MMIAVDVDGLAPEAIARMMQGSRQGFYRGHIFAAISKRIVATLKNDPDLVRLEEEAEEAVSELSAGDDKVKQTLDQLIDSHHEHGHDFAEGAGIAGDTQNSDELGFKTVVKNGVVTLLPPETGTPIRVGADPMLWGVAVATSDQVGHFSPEPSDGVSTTEPIRAAAMAALAVMATRARDQNRPAIAQQRSPALAPNGEGGGGSNTAGSSKVEPDQGT
jgi:hypothetical protein